ncbi:MAG: inositol oxygenase [Blastopirellula sp.]|nr:MAG: inositol oxygenase [Blastopirellula sp.]
MTYSDLPEDNSPLENLHQLEDDLLERYPEPDTAESGSQFTDADKKQSEFRNYQDPARDSVKEFYRLNHVNQTVEFVKQKRAEYLGLNKRKLGVWQALEHLNTLVDDSDPDTDLPQIAHAMQTAEQIRADGHPGWFILTGLIHDLGKVLCLWDEPQWAVVGDTFPVGCKFSDSIVYSEYFGENADHQAPEYQTECGIYEPNCGLDNVLMSWGHDEYLYHVTKDYLPLQALYMIRYHSFYPGHRENAYQHLMNDQDREYFRYVKEFNKYDLYTKSSSPPDVEKLRPYYQELIAEYFPDEIAW